MTESGRPPTESGNGNGSTSSVTGAPRMFFLMYVTNHFGRHP